MKKIFVFFLFLSSGVNTLKAQRLASSLLWEISGKGIQQPSYIFGSFHLLCKADFTVSAILSDKLSKTQKFYGELKMDDPGLQQEMAIKMMLKEQTLSGLVGAEEFGKLNEQFQKLMGMPLQMFNSYKPFMALSLLVINSIACPEKVQPETEFVTLAKQLHLPIDGLETIDEQINAIDKEPLDSQIQSLKQIIGNFDSVKNVMREMISVYQLRDIDTLYHFMKTQGIDSDFEKELLIKRNQKWIPVIEKNINEKATFFVVGAGHLGGPEGIIHLLREKGYVAKPVKY